MKLSCNKASRTIPYKTSHANMLLLLLAVYSFFSGGCNGGISIEIEHCEIDIQIGGVWYREVTETYTYEKYSGSWPKDLFIKGKITTPLSLVTGSGTGQAELEIKKGDDPNFDNVGVDHEKTTKDGDKYTFVSNSLPELPDESISKYVMRWKAYSLKIEKQLYQDNTNDNTTIVGYFGECSSELSMYIDPYDSTTFCHTYGQNEIYTECVDRVPSFTHWGMTVLIILLSIAGIYCFRNNSYWHKRSEIR